MVECIVIISTCCVLYTNSAWMLFQHFWFGFLGNILWCVANVYQLIKNRPELQGVKQPRGLTLLLHINSWIVFLLALAHLSFANAMCKVQVKLFSIHVVNNVPVCTFYWMYRHIKNTYITGLLTRKHRCYRNMRLIESIRV